MSWDIFFMNLPNDIKKIEEIDEDQIEPLGSLNEVAEILKKIIPDFDFSDPYRGVLERGEYSIEINLPQEDVLTSFALHIRGNESVIQEIKKISEQTGWKALDGSEGIIDFKDNPEKGLLEWHKYRNSLVNDLQSKKKKWYIFWK